MKNFSIEKVLIKVNLDLLENRSTFERKIDFWAKLF
jgi:hypothetical protein